MFFLKNQKSCDDSHRGKTFTVDHITVFTVTALQSLFILMYSVISETKTQMEIFSSWENSSGYLIVLMDGFK